MSGHTPGPWYVEPARATGFVITSPCELIAASQDEYGHYGAIHNKANAILMASSPDLLEALQAITDLYAEEMYSERSCKEEDLPEVMLARAAIAKAKGEPQ